MKKKYCFIFILVLILVEVISCKKLNPVSTSSDYIEINLDEIPKKDSLLFSEIFKKIDVIRLSDDMLIRDFSKILVDKEKLYILDKFSSAVFVFDKNGKYLQKIGSRGKGPGELSEAFDMSIDKKNNVIYIIDIKTQKINKYNIEDGMFQSSLSLSTNMPISSYIFYENDTIYISQFNPSKNESEYLFKINPLNNENEDLIIPTSYNKGWDNAMTNYNGPFLLKWDNKPLLSHLFMDTIYEYSNGNTKPYIVLSGIENNFFIQSDLSELDVNKNPMDLIKIVEYKKYHNIHNFIDTNNFIFFKVHKGRQFQNILYNKEKLLAEKVESVKEDMLFDTVDVKRLPLNFGSKDGKFVFYYIAPDDWKTLKKSVDYIKDELLLNVLKTMKDEDSFNGFILRYELAL
ncbi:MAG: 6-bladed beta-propeller [Dysgonamonadaceae bacterium]|nr:6-bladed beta-propeller [Dysgonamonadaceae bacterium]MDD4399655.1 6-bladed beta-propeller [Dysgonamonadaceae bacterium]